MKDTFKNAEDCESIFQSLRVRPDKQVVQEWLNPSTDGVLKVGKKIGFAMQSRPELFPVKEEHAYPEHQNAENDFELNFHPVVSYFCFLS